MGYNQLNIKEDLYKHTLTKYPKTNLILSFIKRQPENHVVQHLPKIKPPRNFYHNLCVSHTLGGLCFRFERYQGNSL